MLDPTQFVRGLCSLSGKAAQEYLKEVARAAKKLAEAEGEQEQDSFAEWLAYDFSQLAEVARKRLP